MSTNPVRPSKSLSTRRSRRLLLKISVVVTRQKENGSSLFERATTEVVAAHGALVLLKEAVLPGQLLQIQNSKTGENLPCKVITAGQKTNGKTEVAFEFLQPAPRSWRIAFPPEDWNLHSPEAKRSGTKTLDTLRETLRQSSAEKN